MKRKVWIIESAPDTFSVVSTAGHRPKNARAMVPKGTPISDYPFMKARKEFDNELQDYIWAPYVDSPAKSAQEALNAKVNSKDQSYKNMVKDVYDNLYLVFRTKRPETATAEYETWKHMKDNPDLYAGAGLKVDHQVNNADDSELFSPGSALDTAQKVQDFATRKIEQAHEYGVYRAGRIQQYKNEVIAIENS